jgi:hypothetical protein
MSKIKDFEGFLNERYLTAEESERMRMIAEAIEELENDENLDEGLKDVILGGLLSLLVTGGVLQAQPTTGNWQTVSKKTEVIDRKHNQVDAELKRTFKLGDNFTKQQADSVVDKMLKKGWSLKSSDIDTIWNDVVKEAPETSVQSVTLTFADGNYFESGKFELSTEMKARIDSSLNNIVEAGGVVIKIDVTSSTDKQGLSKGLQEKLKSLGYTADNAGLSKARSTSIVEYLKSKGVDASLIETENLAEQGTGEIDASSRFVKVDLMYMIKRASETTKSITSKDPEVKYMVNLTKTYVTDSKPSKPSGGKAHVKVGKVKDFKIRGAVKCPKF